MAPSILVLFVIVVGRARTGSRTRADERTFPAANQCSCTCTDGCADADALRSLLFPGLGISIMSVALAASDGNSERERQH